MTFEELFDAVVVKFPEWAVTGNIYGQPNGRDKKYRLTAVKLCESFSLFGTLREVVQQWEKIQLDPQRVK